MVGGDSLDHMDQQILIENHSSIVDEVDDTVDNLADRSILVRLKPETDIIYESPLDKRCKVSAILTVPVIDCFLQFMLDSLPVSEKHFLRLDEQVHLVTDE